MSVRIYEVGGTIRDRLLGVDNKDRDFAVEAESWEAMRDHVHSIADRIFLEKPEHLTIRAAIPTGEIGKKGKVITEARDFVLCRKDGPYSDGRRPDWTEPGTIYDDLARRDFTVNAMAVDLETGDLIDPHGGQADLDRRLLRCVGSTEDRFSEDSLRILRAIRFSLTKGLHLHASIERALLTDDAVRWSEHLRSVSIERVQEELRKCFRHNTPATLRLLGGIHPAYVDVIFADRLWLLPTLEKR